MRKEIVEWVKAIIFALVLALLIRRFCLSQ